MKNRNGGSSFTGVLAIAAVAVAAILLIRGISLSIFTLLRWTLIALAILVAVILAAVFFGLHLSKKDEKQDVPSKPRLTVGEQDTLSKSRRALTELRMKNTRVRDQAVRNGTEGVCKQFDGILQALREHPGQIGEARQCLTYYLPTLGQVMGRYVTLEGSDALTPELREKTMDFLAQVREALEKQYRSLFDGDKLDITVDMEALTLALQRDGLL